MSSLDATAMGLALLLMGCVDFQKSATDMSPDRADIGQDAASIRYEWTEVREVPDGNRRGIVIGPVLTDDNGTHLGSVVLRLDIRHPATSDLDIWLAYDENGDGNPETRAPIEFFRSRPDRAAEELHACPQSLAGSYFFRDDMVGEEAVLSPFLALRRGHAFYLTVADTLAGETGSVLGWAVYLERPALAAQH